MSHVLGLNHGRFLVQNPEPVPKEKGDRKCFDEEVVVLMSFMSKDRADDKYGYESSWLIVNKDAY